MAGSWETNRLAVVVVSVGCTNLSQFLRTFVADKDVIGDDVIKGNVVRATVVARPDLHPAKNMTLVR